VLLGPRKGTQGREMNRKPRIASTLALAVLLSASVPVAVSAGSPLLSGYGGPGAGEQALIGSALLGRPRGGSGSDGSSGSRGSTGAGQGSSGGAAGGSGGASRLGAGALRRGDGGSRSTAARGSHTAPTSARGRARSAGAAQTDGRAGAQAGRAGRNAFAYPSSLRLASADSPALGISGGDLMLLVATIATLTLVGTLTIRLARLQR
jgi:hypothetical protein